VPIEIVNMQGYFSSKTVWIVGYGDIGVRLGQRLRAEGSRVVAIKRHAAVDAVPIDLDQPCHGALAALPLADTVFYLAPPPLQGRTDPRVEPVLHSQPQADWLYLSTSGVYGDCQGRWIDVLEPLKPTSDRAQRRFAAEQAVLKAVPAAKILRVPGIYGPGRLPVERLKAQTPVLQANVCPYTNRIHSEDLVSGLLHVIQYGEAGQAYNISDGHPTGMTDYFLKAARLLNLPEPTQVSWEVAMQTFSPMLKSFMEESKRLKTDKIRALGWSPRYPTLAEGLPSCL
jgi:nucleoside-diphosphate-sugar epimerase